MPQEAVCDFGCGRLSSPWSSGAVQASGAIIVRSPFLGADRRRPAAGGQTAAGGSTVDCMGDGKAFIRRKPFSRHPGPQSGCLAQQTV